MFFRLRPFSRNVFLLLAILLFLIVFFTCSFFIIDQSPLYEQDMQLDFLPTPKTIANIHKCFKSAQIDGTDSKHSILYFEDILESKRQPTSGNTIFFHETSCSKTGIAELNAK